MPSSFRQHRSRLRRSNTSCAGGNPLLLPLRLQPLSLLVTVGAPLWPPPLPRRSSSLPPCGVMEIQAPATSHHTQAGLLCFPPHEEESGECYTTHPDPAPCHHRPGRHRPRAGSLCSTSLPHHGYVGDPVGAAGTVSRSLASAPQSVSVAPTDHQTQLCDSVRPAPPPSSGASGSLQSSPPMLLSCMRKSQSGEGRDRAGPSSRYGVGVVQPLLHCAQERWWVTTDLGSASFEPCTSQAAVQDVDTETHFWARPSPRLVCSDRPEGRILSCLDPPATRDDSYDSRSRVGHISTRSCPSGCPCRLTSSPKSWRRPLSP